MFSSILSADVRGITGVPIFVETDISDGFPGPSLGLITPPLFLLSPFWNGNVSSSPFGFTGS